MYRIVLKLLKIFLNFIINKRKKLFWETTKKNVSEQIKQVDETLKSKTTQPKYNEITKALDENLRRGQKQRKTS